MSYDVAEEYQQDEGRRPSRVGREIATPTVRQIEELDREGLFRLIAAARWVLDTTYEEIVHRDRMDSQRVARARRRVY